jgi:Fe-S oxidoreductase
MRCARSAPRTTIRAISAATTARRESPRKLLKTIGIQVVEMERNGMRGRCCGGGGGAPLTDIPGKQRIPDIRIADARAIGADVVAVGCPNCTAMLEGVVARAPMCST